MHQIKNPVKFIKLYRQIFEDEEHINSLGEGYLTLSGGKWVGSEGLAKSHIQISPSSAPDARRFGAMALNSRPRTWNIKTSKVRLHKQYRQRRTKNNLNSARWLINKKQRKTYWSFMPHKVSNKSIFICLRTVKIYQENKPIGKAKRKLYMTLKYLELLNIYQ